MVAELVEELADAGGGQAERDVGGAIVEVQGVAVGAQGVPAGKDHVSHVPDALILGLGAEDPLIAPKEAAGRALPVEGGRGPAGTGSRRRCGGRRGR